MPQRAEIKHIDANAAANDRHEHQIFITDADDVVVTLPKSDHSTKGLMVTIVQQNVSAGTGVSFDPNDADTIHGQTIAGVAIDGAAGKKLINTGATDVLGDRATLVSDGDGHWYIVSLQGIWAAEA